MALQIVIKRLGAEEKKDTVLQLNDMSFKQLNQYLYMYLCEPVADKHNKPAYKRFPLVLEDQSTGIILLKGRQNLPAGTYVAHITGCLIVPDWGERIPVWLPWYMSSSVLKQHMDTLDTFKNKDYDLQDRHGKALQLSADNKDHLCRSVMLARAKKENHPVPPYIPAEQYCLAVPMDTKKMQKLKVNATTMRNLLDTYYLLDTYNPSYTYKIESHMSLNNLPVPVFFLFAKAKNKRKQPDPPPLIKVKITIYPDKITVTESLSTIKELQKYAKDNKLKLKDPSTDKPLRKWQPFVNAYRIMRRLIWDQPAKIESAKEAEEKTMKEVEIPEDIQTVQELIDYVMEAHKEAKGFNIQIYDGGRYMLVNEDQLPDQFQFYLSRISAGFRMEVFENMRVSADPDWNDIVNYDPSLLAALQLAIKDDPTLLKNKEWTDEYGADRSRLTMLEIMYKAYMKYKDTYDFGLSLKKVFNPKADGVKLEAGWKYLKDVKYAGIDGAYSNIWEENKTAFVDRLCSKDTGGGGDCFFSSMAASYNDYVETLSHNIQDDVDDDATILYDESKDDTYKNLSKQQVRTSLVKIAEAKWDLNQLHKFYMEDGSASGTKYKTLFKNDPLKAKENFLKYMGTSSYWGDSKSIQLLMQYDKQFMKLGLINIGSDGRTELFHVDSLNPDDGMGQTFTAGRHHVLMIFNYTGRHFTQAAVMVKEMNRWRMVKTFSSHSIPSTIRGIYFLQENRVLCNQ